MLSSDWNNIYHIVLYGYGTVGKSCLNKIKKDFKVDYIIDRNVDEIGDSISDISVVSPEKGLADRTTQRIIVMTGGRVYLEISNYLRDIGLKEYQDYCSIEHFITEWYWKNRKENCVMELHSAVTMDCTLKCKNCNMFVPYYIDKVYYDVNSVKEEIDLLFEYVDFCFCYTLLGGEPFLHKRIIEVIKYLGDRFADQIGKIKIITNGTIIPDDEIMGELKRYDVWVSISDYTGVVPYNDKLRQLCNRFDKYGIDYSVAKQDKWLAFGFPQNPFCFDIGDCAQHMRECSPIFHGYNDKKVYYCHVAWSAEKIGKYSLEESDYIDLTTLDKKDRHIIAEHCLGRIKNGYISFCRLCGGCGRDNLREVVPGEQIERE